MCGIFAYLGASTGAARIVLEGLKKLEYRGYDSWGIATPHAGRAVLDRQVGKIGSSETTLPPTHVALGHTRWATHGGVTRRNAHPHLDCNGRIALIHNGIIENHQALRAEIERRDHRFRSSTDTEVVAHMLEELLAAGVPLITATMQVFRRLEGLNAIAVLEVATGAVAAAKSGSPLVLGWGEDANLMASDAAALIPHTRRVTFLEDGQAALIERSGIQVFDVASGDALLAKIEIVDWDAGDDSMAGHKHFMAKEIREQPAVLRRLAVADGPLDELAGALTDAGPVLLTGCGSAYHAALAGTYYFARLAGLLTHAIAASELPYRIGVGTAPASEYVKGSGTSGGAPWLIAVSQSGETIDVLDAVRAARAHGMRIAAITNVQGSSLYRQADIPVIIGAGPERAVLATKTFTAQVTALALTAWRMAGRVDEGRLAVERAANACEAVIGAQARALGIAARVHTAKSLLVLGRGLSYPAAMEAALKVKEVSYMHAEGFASGELKHGVIALVEPGTPCLVFAPRDETFAAAVSGAMEVKARGALTLGLSPADDPAFDARLDVADCGDLTLLPQTVASQLLAYHLAILRECDPDKPRNLAKCVTVR